MNTGGPAFPCDLTMYDQEIVNQFQGMTLRDYFASKAMQSLLMSLPSDSILCDSKVAKWAYDMANAMLKAREQ